MIEAFTKRVLELVQREFPTRGFRLGEELGVITDGRATFGMSNLLAQYQQSPLSEEAFEQAVIEKFADALQMIEGAAAAVIPESWEEARGRLRVQLVSDRVADLDRIVTFPFADDVHSSLVVDSDKGYAFVGAEDLRRWDQTAVDAIEVGQQNLVLARSSLPMTVMPEPAPLVIIQTGDGYDAARILIRAIRDRIVSELAGEDEDAEVFVGVPNRDFLIAWPQTIDAEIHHELSQTVAQDAQQQSHPLCQRVLRVSRDHIDLV